MIARLTTWGNVPLERRDDLKAYIEEQIQHSRTRAGWLGGTWLLDAERREMVVVGLWETAESAEAQQAGIQSARQGATGGFGLEFQGVRVCEVLASGQR